MGRWLSASTVTARVALIALEETSPGSRRLGEEPCLIDVTFRAVSLRLPGCDVSLHELYRIDAVLSFWDSCSLGFTPITRSHIFPCSHILKTFLGCYLRCDYSVLFSVEP